MISREATHVDFVAILFVVWGALTALVGVSTLVLGVGTASLTTSTSTAATPGTASSSAGTSRGSPGYSPAAAAIAGRTYRSARNCVSSHSATVSRKLPTMIPTLAIIAILWGVAHILIGVPLHRHSPRARLLAILTGSIDLILLPFGTPLGIYALWVLLNERGKAVFGVRYS